MTAMPRRPLALPALFALSLPAWGQLEEVHVIGSRDLLGDSLDSAAQTVFSEDQVTLNRTVADWIERMPGVSLNGQGGLLQSYSVRGFSRWRLRTEVDGVPIITDRRAGNSASFIPPDLLQSTSVQRGPGSALYGSGAMGGVISLGTLQAERLSVSAASQSGDRQRSVTVATGEAERYTAAISYRRADEAEDARGNALNSGFEQLAGLVKYQLPVGEKRLTLSWLPSLGEDIGKSSAFYPDRQISSYPEEQHSVAKAELRSADDWLVQVYHHFQDWESSTLRIGSRRNDTKYRGHTIGSLFYQRLDYLDGSGRWGLEWTGRRSVEIDEREYDSEGDFVYRQQLIDGEQDNLGVFLDHSWQLGALELGGGLRYDYVNQSEGRDSRSDSQLDFSVRSAWYLDSGWVLTGELGSGFRFPTLTELYFNGTTPRGDTIGNTQLEPESNRAAQLGLQFEGDALQLNASVYYNDLNDYIERYRVSDDLRSYRNLDDAEIYGYEVSLGWQPAEGWHHEISYQWQRGEDDDDNWLADLNPPGVRYLLSWQGGAYNASSDLSYRQSRDDFGEGEQALDSATIWNASAGRNWGESWNVELYATNLLDQFYTGSADEDAAYQPGRTVGLRLAWAYR